MQTIARLDFTAVKTEGAILPADLLARVAQGNDLPGLSPEDYHLAANERLNEAVNRAWNRCQAAWAGFEEGRARLPDDDAGTTLTRERWLLILFQELGYGRLQTARAASMGGYPISHAWHSVPIHLVSFRQDLDRRGTYTGAVTRSPHGLVQEYLNRTEESLWGFVSNGLRLRILRDNVSLSRLAYVDFDLEAIMSGQLYADFTLLWLLCHQSRVEGERPSECWLERWSREAAQQGARALDSLRDGVREAIEALGRGFLAHPANDALRDRLRAGSLSTQDYYRQLLRLVYRLIFLCVAEDRDLLLLPAEGAGGQDGAGIAEARKRYTEYYSMARLRRLAGSVRGGPHPDLYASLSLVFRMLRTGYPDLALPGLGGFLFSNRATPDLDEASLANADLLEAVRSLAFTVEGRVRRPVDYRNLGSEELGSVYESLLELHPEVTTNQAAPSFVLNAVAGTERKTTGSYYTPPSLVNSLLDSALEPVVEDRLKAARRAGSPDDEAQAALEEALLSIRVVDPACGSGHFLVAAAHRLAHHLAGIRSGEEEPGPAMVRQAMRDVVRRCIFGVDLNEMAVELCKFALWLETMDPGKPLGFLDHNIQCGNSLLGATPELIEAGLPDDAFKPITGDDRAIASDLRKRNKREREGQGALFLGMGPQTSAGNAGAAMAALDAMPEDTTEAVRAREARHNAALADPAYRQAKLLADAWCAAFVWPKWRGAPPAVTTATLRALATRPERVPAATVAEIERLAGQYRFFHWHLTFPEVFEEPLPSPSPFRGGSSPLLAGEGSGERSRGFDVVLGNPPWEHTELKEKEWFAARRPDIAEAGTGAQRKRMIDGLATADPGLYADFLAARRHHDGIGHFVGSSGRFPLCGRGRINTYAAFAELDRSLLAGRGRAGIIVPTGIATDDTTKYFFQDLTETGRLASLYDFDNREKLFPAVISLMKFCLLTMTGPKWPVEAAEFVFFAHRVEDLEEEERRLRLSAADIALLNPNTRTCPIFRSRRDAELTKGIYRRVPVLIDEGREDGNPWGISFKQGLFNMTSDSHLFRTREQLEREGWRLEGNVFRRGGQAYLPLYEAKMIHHFDHRWATYDGGDTRDLTAAEKRDPHFWVQPRYWVPEGEVAKALEAKWDRDWLLGWRGITNTTNERTVIAAIIPRTGVGNNIPLMLGGETDAKVRSCLAANLSAFAYDYASRQKVGGTNLNFFIYEQLPVLPPATYSQPCPWAAAATVGEWLLPRVLELTYTAWDLAPFARDCGYQGPPFRWDDERRFQIRCELDAAFFHLYGIAREDVDYIMDTFPIVRRKDEAAHGEYRTKRAILKAYDEMAKGEYRSPLDPPPGDARAAHSTTGAQRGA